MTNVTISHSDRGLNRSSVLSGLTLISTVVARALRHLKDRREMNKLLELPDHALKDIGIQRSDIQREALKSLWH